MDVGISLTLCLHILKSRRELIQFILYLLYSRKNEKISSFELIEISKYLEKLLEKIKERLIWPEWLVLTEKVFDFSSKLTLDQRKPALKELMKVPASPHSLLPEEKQRLLEEYGTLFLIATEELKRVKQSQEQLLYNICTKKDHYELIPNILGYGFRFLCKTLNECVLESFFSTVNETDSSGKPFSHDTVEKICFIRMNGPDPLVGKPLIRSALNEHFNGKWHFVTDTNKFYTSPAIQTQVKAAQKKFSLF